MTIDGIYHHLQFDDKYSPTKFFYIKTYKAH